MARSTPRTSALLFGFLALYILLQSSWWMWLLLSKDRDVLALQDQLIAAGVAPSLPVRLPQHSLMMVLGEGVVFLVLIVLGLWITYRTLRHELTLARQQRDFLLATSHELRTPIAAIKLHLQTLQRPDLDEDRRELLGKSARHDVDRLQVLTEKILLASRLEENIVPTDLKAVDLTQETTVLLEEARNSYGREHRISATLQGPLMIRTDPVLYRSICENLLENACKYSPRDSEVHVELSSGAGSIRLSVQDNGPGIPLEDRQRIFEKFVRGGNEETRDTKGTGLGLFIVRRLMETLGGRVEYPAGASAGFYLYGPIPTSSMTLRKAALIILDGWGIGAGDSTDAIAQAKTPFIDSLYREAPHAQLLTDGEHVGLPKGQMGNSEVGHLNIGAGRIVYQDLLRIDRAVADGSLARNPVLQETFKQAAEPGKRLHFMGLLGHGGVHAMQSHLVALCKMATAAGLKDVFIHGFTDGRDTDPKSGLSAVRQLEKDIAGTSARIATLCGRYYAMDRDKRWERVRKAYDLLIHGTGTQSPSATWALEESYIKGITDEFLEPCAIVGTDGRPLAHIRPGDVVICFNFRTDRCREITEALTQKEFPEQHMKPLDLHYVTMTLYDHRFKDVRVIFTKDDLPMTLGEVVAKAGGTQVRMAETEKYPHVTFFFSGGREDPFTGEDRSMIPSPKVATYDLQPEMSAPALTDDAVGRLNAGDVDLMIVNFANPDMVGHTGVFPAIVKAVETADSCARRVVEAGRKNGYSFVIIADHGNADKAVNPDGSPNTAHTTNPVPVFILTNRKVTVHNGILADVAPTLLDLMGISKPTEMTGSSLIG